MWILQLKALLGFLLLGSGQVLLDMRIVSQPVVHCTAEDAGVDSVFFKGQIANAWNQSLLDLLESGFTIAYHVQAASDSGSSGVVLSRVQAIKKDIATGRYTLSGIDGSSLVFETQSACCREFQQFRFGVASRMFLQQRRALELSIELQPVRSNMLSIPGREFWIRPALSARTPAVSIEVLAPPKGAGRGNAS